MVKKYTGKRYIEKRYIGKKVHREKGRQREKGTQGGAPSFWSDCLEFPNRGGHHPGRHVWLAPGTECFSFPARNCPHRLAAIFVGFHWICRRTFGLNSDEDPSNLG